MTCNPDIHHRRSIRLKGYDYSQAGAYFVSICTHNRECLLGQITDGKMVLNDVGQMVADSWKWLAEQYDHVSLDECVVMPNHLHGIIVIIDGCRGGSRTTMVAGAGLKPAPAIELFHENTRARCRVRFEDIYTSLIAVSAYCCRRCPGPGPKSPSKPPFFFLLISAWSDEFSLLCRLVSQCVTALFGL